MLSQKAEWRMWVVIFHPPSSPIHSDALWRHSHRKCRWRESPPVGFWDFWSFEVWVCDKFKTTLNSGSSLLYRHSSSRVWNTRERRLSSEAQLNSRQDRGGKTHQHAETQWGDNAFIPPAPVADTMPGRLALLFDTAFPPLPKQAPAAILDFPEGAPTVSFTGRTALLVRRAALPHKTSSLDPPRTHCTSFPVVVQLNLLHCIYSGLFSPVNMGQVNIVLKRIFTAFNIFFAVSWSVFPSFIPERSCGEF